MREKIRLTQRNFSTRIRIKRKSLEIPVGLFIMSRNCWWIPFKTSWCLPSPSKLPMNGWSLPVSFKYITNTWSFCKLHTNQFMLVEVLSYSDFSRHFAEEICFHSWKKFVVYHSKGNCICMSMFWIISVRYLLYVLELSIKYRKCVCDIAVSVVWQGARAWICT